MKYPGTQATLLLLSSAFCSHALFAQTEVASVAKDLPPSITSSKSSGGAVSMDGPIVSPECGDALSAALSVNGSTDLPCWANIRAVERWNAADIPDGGGLRGSDSLHLPRDASSQFSLAAGGIGGTQFYRSDTLNVYGGLLGASAFLDRERWQLSIEDAGALTSAEASGGSSGFAGLNRGAIRIGVQPTERLTWQASAANSFGNDALRLVAPLDERRVGSGAASTELPVADSVVYGLHVGNVVDEQEDTRVRYEQTRRSNWEFAAGHTLQHYADTGTTVQTVRGRAEFLHAWNDHAALGLFGHTERQNGPAGCSLTGGGIRSVSTWDDRASLNLSGAVSASDVTCGKSVTFTGDAAFSMRAGDRNWISFTANRGLSDGVIERVAVLNTAVFGVRHSFHSLVDLRLSAAGVMGNDVFTKQTYTGTFATATMSYPIGTHLNGETSLRHIEMTPAPGGANRTVFVTSIWYSPRSHAGQAR